VLDFSQNAIVRNLQKNPSIHLNYGRDRLIITYIRFRSLGRDRRVLSELSVAKTSQNLTNSQHELYAVETDKIESTSLLIPFNSTRGESQ